MSECYYTERCYACSGKAEGVRDLRLEGGVVEAACQRHRDPRIRATACCVFCSMPVRGDSLVIDGDFVHKKCQAEQMRENPEQTVGTCSVCFQEFVLTRDGRPKRHGFSAINIRHGQSGGWHTGPCMGADYSHYGISAEGTVAALDVARKRLREVESQLNHLAVHPELMWFNKPPRYEERRGARPEPLVVRRGDDYEYVQWGNRKPSYDSLWNERVREAQQEHGATAAMISFYEKKIADWKPAAAATRETRGKTVHAAFRPPRYPERVVALCQGLAGKSHGKELTDDPSAVTCQRCIKSLEARGRRRNGSSLRNAEDLFEKFHQFEPNKITRRPDLDVPARLTHVGEAKVMYYASDKLNPDTGEDEGWIHYFHEHEGGVKFCVVDPESDGDEIEVPAFIRRATALVRIGDCEGFEYEDHDGETVEAEGTGRLPEWYATPCGRALLVIQDKRRLIACLWGGDLDVRPEGVVG